VKRARSRGMIVAMKPLAALLLLAGACSAAESAPPPEPGAILAPVIASQARVYAHEAVPCVRAAIDEMAFDEQRRTLASLSRPERTNDSSRAELDRLRSGLSSPQYRWMTPSARPGEWGTKVPLPPAEASALSQAAGEIVRGPAKVRTVSQIDAAWLPATLHLCGGEPLVPYLIFSAPAVRGDTAFVETGYVCAGLCGNGLLYALRRTSSGWRIVSVAFTWVS
jgi:hypothetical protein